MKAKIFIIVCLVLLAAGCDNKLTSQQVKVENKIHNFQDFIPGVFVNLAASGEYGYVSSDNTITIAFGSDYAGNSKGLADTQIASWEISENNFKIFDSVISNGTYNLDKMLWHNDGQVAESGSLYFAKTFNDIGIFLKDKRLQQVSFLNCGSGGLNQYEINKCAVLYYENSSRRLLAVTDLFAQQETQKKNISQVKNTQKIWEQYRKSACDLDKLIWDGGTAESAAYYGCLNTLTRDRVEFLENYIPN